VPYTFLLFRLSAYPGDETLSWPIQRQDYEGGSDGLTYNILQYYYNTTTTEIGVWNWAQMHCRWSSYNVNNWRYNTLPRLHGLRGC